MRLKLKPLGWVRYGDGVDFVLGEISCLHLWNDVADDVRVSVTPKFDLKLLIKSTVMNPTFPTNLNIHQSMLRVNIVTHENLVEFAMVTKQSQFCNSLRIRKMVNLFVHLEMRTFKTEEVVLTVTTKVGIFQKLVVQDRA